MNYHAYMQQHRNFKPHLKFTAVAVLSLLGFLGTAQLAFGQSTPAPEPATQADPVVNNSAMDAETFYKILLAELNLLDEEPRIGFALMLDSARKTKDALLFERAITIALQARSGDSALSAARAWLVAMPTSTDAARYLVQITISMNRLELPAGKADLAIALEVAKRALAKNPSDEEAAQLAIALMTTKEPMAEQLVKQFLSHPTNQTKHEMRLAYARTLVSLSRLNDAISQAARATTDSPTYAPAWLLLGTLEYRWSVETAEKAADSAGTNLSRAENGAIAAAIAVSAQAALNKFIQLTDPLPAAQRSASLSRAYTLLANMAKNNKQYQQAYDTLSKAIANSNEEDKPDLQYDLAMMAEKLGRMDEMERILRQVIEAKPEDPQAYNALGYSLADRNLRLTEAKDLIQKAVKLAPKDPFIADSLGWVEFKLGNLAEAQRILEAAYTSKPDAEIAAHLGEVLWKQGLKDRATALWKEGVKINKNNDTLLETLKRFSVKF
jgi:tetratricopeptide (TPR) repeat protein